MLARSERICFQVEKLKDILSEINELAADHYLEFASGRDARPLNPNFELRLHAESKGIFFAVTARRAGRIVGYAWWFIDPDLTSKEIKIGDTDVYFVSKCPTRGVILLGLMRFSIKMLKARGCQMIHARTKIGSDGDGRDAGRLWKALGLRPTDMIYSGRL